MRGMALLWRETHLGPGGAAVRGAVDAVRPSPELLRSLASPVPTQTTLGSEGATATAPMEATGCLSKTGAKVAPAFTVFQTPPVARPT